MKICVFGASSQYIDEDYITKVEELGEMLARRGHSLVFGAGATGLMGAAARGVKRENGYIMGVIPQFFKDDGVEVIYNNCDKLVFTETMSERKKLMEDEADAFIIVPGGIGTLEEYYEVLTLKQLGRHSKAISIYNIQNYYDELEEFMKIAADRSFVNFRHGELYQYHYTAEECLDYIESYTPTDRTWQDLKIGK